jgi:hypothetical protein
MDLHAIRDEIGRAARAYADLPRHVEDTRPVVARKLEAAFRRRVLLQRLLSAAEAERAGPDRLLAPLLSLGLPLDDASLARVRALVGDGADYGQVLARQGVRWPAAPEHHALAGPGLDLRIEANRDSPWRLEKWMAIPEFGEYAFRGDAVDFRGVEIRPGDVILANVNLDGNFVYSAFPDPKCVFTHSAVVVFFFRDGRRYPAVVETYERGVRAVPLSVFLNARFTAYAEVYRHRDVGPEHAPGLAEAAAAMVRDTRGYNARSWDDDRSYLSCTSVGRFLLEDVGVGGIVPRSRITHPRILENLASVGYTGLDPFFAPVDYLTNPLFSFQGVVDNGQFFRLLARELAERRFRELFEQRRLDTRGLPFTYGVNRIILRKLRSGSALAPLVTPLTGWTRANLPKGPDAMLAGITPAEHELGKAVRALVPLLERRLAGQERFDLEEPLADAWVREQLERVLRPRWLVD